MNSRRFNGLLLAYLRPVGRFLICIARSRVGRLMGMLGVHIRESAQPLLLILVCSVLYFAIHREIAINRNFDSIILRTLEEIRAGRKQYLALHDVTHQKQDRLQATADAIRIDVENIGLRLGVRPATLP